MAEKKERIILSLSGGMDSATLLAIALDQGKQVIPVMFQYGSKHNGHERVAVRQLASFYATKAIEPIVEMDLTEIGFRLKSNLLQSGDKLPEGHYEEESMRQTVVPGRNIIFSSILAGLAWSNGCGQIWLGIHAGDHHIYPDCRPEFFEAMNRAVQTGTDFQVEMKAPFLNIKKADILHRGLMLKVPYELTRTCYSQDRTACGRCGACQERLEAFLFNKKEDPLEYQSRELFPKKS